jgi:hypothetical protein
MLAVHYVLGGDLLRVLDRLALRRPLDILGDLPNLVLIAVQNEARQIRRRNRRRENTIIARSLCA